MSFFSFLKKTKEGSHSLVLNVSSGSVAGAVIKFTEKPGVQVLHYYKESFPIQQEISPGNHLELMKISIATLVDKIRKEKPPKFTDAYLIFSSPWSVSQTKTIRMKESKTFRITESYVNSAIAGQEKNTDISAHGKIIERKIIQMRINGYPVTELDKLTKEAEVSVFYTVIPEDILRAVEDSIAKSFMVKNIWCHSTSLSIFSIIRDLFPNRENFIYTDVSDEMTDISIVKGGVAIKSMSIPFGHNGFVRELAKALNVTEIIAESMLKMNNLKHTDQLAALKVSTALNTIADNWTRQVTEAINQSGENLYTQQTLFFIATDDLSTVLGSKLKTDTLEVIPMGAKKIISPIKIEDMIFKTSLVFLDKIYKI